MVATALPAAAGAFDLEDELRRLHVQYAEHQPDDLRVAQGGCVTLDQAIERVRRRGDVERIISADTRRDGNRVTHYVKYLTRDHKVRTQQFNGCA